jgi:hypothetical protein
VIGGERQPRDAGVEPAKDRSLRQALREPAFFWKGAFFVLTSISDHRYRPGILIFWSSCRTWAILPKWRKGVRKFRLALGVRTDRHQCCGTVKRTVATVVLKQITQEIVVGAAMSEHSKIEWTEATWNPVRGCTKISPGCKHCYAETFAERFRGVPGHPYGDGFDPRLVPDKLLEPLRWGVSANRVRQ